MLSRQPPLPPVLLAVHSKHKGVRGLRRLCTGCARLPALHSHTALLKAHTVRVQKAMACPRSLSIMQELL